MIRNQCETLAIQVRMELLETPHDAERFLIDLAVVLLSR